MSKKLAALLFVCLLSITIILVRGAGMKNKEMSTMEKYPTRPVTMIVPISPGGSPDLMARAMEKAAVKHLGQPLVIQNIVGGAGTLGWNELAGAKPDGYTVGVTANGIIMQPLYGPTRYHYSTALEPLAQAVSLPIVAAVLSNQPWDNIDDFVKYAKQHPGEIKFGHPGLGSPRHVVGEMFAKDADIQITQVPFTGEPESLTALLGGHIQLIFINSSVIKEYVKSGKVKVLAVAAEHRLTDPEFKNVPTFKEKGLDVVFNLWHGVAVPKSLPQDVKKQLVEGFKAIIHDPQFQKNMEDLGMTIEYLGPEKTSEKWIEENTRLAKIIKETGIAERIAAQKNSK